MGKGARLSPSGHDGDGGEERRGELRGPIGFGLRNLQAKDLACCGPKCAALEPMSRSSESLFQPLELERAPEESLARRGMERHDVAGPPVTAALVPS